jgi:hypothetical protein
VSPSEKTPVKGYKDMKLRLFAAVAAALVTQSAAAEIFFCQITEHNRHKGLPPELLIVYEPGKKTVGIIDAYTLKDGTGPRDTKVTRWADNRVDFSYDMMLFGTSTLAESVTTRLSIGGIFFPDRRTLRMNGIPHGFSNSFSGDGSCTPVDKKTVRGLRGALGN